MKNKLVKTVTVRLSASEMKYCEQQGNKSEYLRSLIKREMISQGKDVETAIHELVSHYVQGGSYGR